MTLRFSFGVVDLRGLDAAQRYGQAAEEGEYRRVLDLVTEAGWSFLNCGDVPSGLIGVGKLEAADGRSS